MPKTTRKSIERLRGPDRAAALDEFAERLPAYFSRDNKTTKAETVTKPDKITKKSILDEVGKKLGVTFHAKQFDKFVNALFVEEYLKIVPRTLSKESLDLQRKFPIADATVVSGKSSDRFFDVAAKKFIGEISRVASKKSRGAELCIGIMSGTTTQGVVNRSCAIDWLREAGVDPRRLPPMKLFPLNVSFTDPEYLSGNATILAFNLAARIRAQGGSAEAFGLNAPLTIEKLRLPEIDKVAQTRKVLEYTDPARLEAGENKPYTRLDVALLGAGERPKNEEEGGSIFFTLARTNGFPIKEFLEQNRVVGDLALIPLCSNGLPAKLNDAQGNEFIFYSTIRLEVLEAMAANKDHKSVILVAQSSEQKYKVPVIFASIGGATNYDGRKCYVSRLIVDEPTAQELLRF